MENKKNKNSKTLKQKFKNEIVEFLTEASVQGIPRIVKNAENKNWLISALWGLLFIISFSYCLSTIVDSFQDYFKYEVKTSILKLQQYPNEFPAITICNVNPFNEVLALESLRNLTDLVKCFEVSTGTEFQNCASNFYGDPRYDPSEIHFDLRLLIISKCS